MNTTTFSPALLAHLLLPLSGVRVQQVGLFSTQVLLRLVATASTARCPVCATPSSSVHSSYTRQLADLPWGRARVHILLRVRKFRCGTPTCPQRVFERLPTLVAPYARQTARRQPSCAPSAWRWADALPCAWPTACACRPAAPACCASCARPFGPSMAACGSSASTIGPFGAATTRAPSSWTWSATNPWTCCRIANPHGDRLAAPPPQYRGQQPRPRQRLRRGCYPGCAPGASGRR